MPLHYIIDGYNVINHRSFAAGRRKINSPQFALIDLIRIKRLCGSLKNRITVVFDGYCNEVAFNYRDKDIKVIFSGEQTADDKIKILIEKSADIRNIIVISEDREIVSFGKAAGCSCRNITEFIEGRSGSSKKNKNACGEKNLSKEDLNYSQAGKINEELRKLWLM